MISFVCMLLNYFTFTFGVRYDNTPAVFSSCLSAESDTFLWKHCCLCMLSPSNLVHL